MIDRWFTDHKYVGVKIHIYPCHEHVTLNHKSYSETIVSHHRMNDQKSSTLIKPIQRLLGSSPMRTRSSILSSGSKNDLCKCYQLEPYLRLSLEAKSLCARPNEIYASRKCCMQPTNLINASPHPRVMPTCLALTPNVHSSHIVRLSK